MALFHFYSYAYSAVRGGKIVKDFVRWIKMPIFVTAR